MAEVPVVVVNGEIKQVYGTPSNPAPQPTEYQLEGYTLIDETDPLYVAWLTSQANYQAYLAALAAGVQITSTSTPGISGTYAIDSNSLVLISGELMNINATGKFTNGQTSRVWSDKVKGVAPHLFSSTAQFVSFAEAVASYKDAVETAYATPGAWVAPPMPTIP